MIVRVPEVRGGTESEERSGRGGPGALRRGFFTNLSSSVAATGRTAAGDQELYLNMPEKGMELLRELEGREKSVLRSAQDTARYLVCRVLFRLDVLDGE
jgi:hypothetical protein